jgi:hypothetical protein
MAYVSCLLKQHGQLARTCLRITPREVLGAVDNFLGAKGSPKPELTRSKKNMAVAATLAPMPARLNRFKVDGNFVG